ncbi:MAG TPA: response regulator [Kofleriaceae bacterium]|jgi:FixJ family two-component response regulator
MKRHASTKSHPIAHITVEDAACRSKIADALRAQGWTVIEHPTGLHLIHAISGLILGDEPWRRPGLIVADAAARGCSGVSIARGLRDLGSRIPVIVVARAADELVAMREGPLTIVKPEDAQRTVELFARSRRHRRPIQRHTTQLFEARKSFAEAKEQ